MLYCYYDKGKEIVPFFDPLENGFVIPYYIKNYKNGLEKAYSVLLYAVCLYTNF
jgi:hypothetical protein